MKIEKRPLVSFLSILGVFLLLIFVGNLIRKPIVQKTATNEPRQVSVYTIGSVPKVNFQAKIEKSGVLHISAPISGVVNSINVKEGMKVAKGSLLVTLANSYAGGNSFTLSRQLAEKQRQFAENNYEKQQSIISIQRDLANNNNSNFKQLRDITKQSIDSTKSQINLNKDIISNLNTNIQNLSVDPVGNAALILSSKQMLSQFQAANSQLENGIKNAEYQTDSNNPPSKLSSDQKKLALAQLDIQANSLDLNKEISNLQLKLAQVNESLMFPVAPFSGTIEQVKVRIGQSINPGTELLVLSSDTNTSAKAVIYLPKDVASNISKTEPTLFTIEGKTVGIIPSYVSQEATNDNFYSAIYILPSDSYQGVTDSSYISAQVPVGYANSSSVAPYIPLDAVYQTQDTAYTFLLNEGKAVSTKIELGQVYGSYVRVVSGLTNGDVVINDRNVVDGDSVKAR